MPQEQFVISARKVVKDEFRAEPGPLRYLRVPAASAVPLPEHAVKSGKEVAQWLQDVRGLADGDQNPYSISPKGDVLVFVHGYNNNVQVVIDRHRQLERDLKAEGWRGVVVSFDWPSADSTLNYLEDRRDAAEVAVELVRGGIKLIADGQADGCETNVHLLGHSTGAYVIMEAMAQAEKDGALFKSAWRTGQVAFIGGDVSSDSLSAGSVWAAPMFRRIMRLTNYANPYDSVLAVSNAKRLGVSPRVGRVGAPADAHPKVANVNCGEYFLTLNPNTATHFGTFNHSWHIGDRVWARDLALTLEGAIDRHAIPTRRIVNGAMVLQDRPRPTHMAAWGIS